MRCMCHLCDQKCLQRMPKAVKCQIRCPQITTALLLLPGIIIIIGRTWQWRVCDSAVWLRLQVVRDERRHQDDVRKAERLRDGGRTAQQQGAGGPRHEGHLHDRRRHRQPRRHGIRHSHAADCRPGAQHSLPELQPGILFGRRSRCFVNFLLLACVEI